MFLYTVPKFITFDSEAVPSSVAQELGPSFRSSILITIDVVKIYWSASATFLIFFFSEERIVPIQSLKSIADNISEQF